MRFRFKSADFTGKKSAQSAMEYLMTYGWAILVIAIVAALLFALGLFGQSSSNLPEGCMPQTGFICSNPSYTPNGIVLTVGQESGQYYYGDWVFVASTSEHLDSNGLPDNMSFVANMISIGALTPGQTATVNFMKTDAGGIPTANVLVGQPLTAYVWLGYCTVPGCGAPTSYTRIGTINTKFSGASAFTGSSSITTSTTSSSTTSTSTTSTSSTTTSTTTSTTSTISCSGPTDPYTGYTGGCNIVFDTGGTLSGNIITQGSITIDSSVTLTTDGYVLVSGAVFTNSGAINSGTDPGTGGAACQQCTASPGVSHPSSYGGSGGSGSQWWCSGSDNSGAGGNTLAQGGLMQTCNDPGAPGSTPAAPIMTALLVQTCYNNGMQSCLEGGGGGGSVAGTSPAGGADDAYGVFVEAVTLNAGTINTVGGSAGTYNGGAGGGGGSGTIMLVYNYAYTAGTYNSIGGQGGGNCSSFGGCIYTSNGIPVDGGNGGAGQTLVYQYSGSPPAST